MNTSSMGFLRVACASYDIKTANISANANIIKNIIEKTESTKTGLLLLPPLALTGSACGDLFLQRKLYDAQRLALFDITEYSEKAKATIIMGAFEKHEGSLYDAYAVIQNGKLMCATDDMLLSDEENELLIGFDDTCDIQLMTSNEELTVGQTDYVKNLVVAMSAKNKNILMYTAANGILAIAENGKLLEFKTPFDSSCDNFDMVVCDVDTQIIAHERLALDNFAYNFEDDHDVEPIEPLYMYESSELLRKISAHPFRPDDLANLNANCMQIFEIQAQALAKRLAHTHSKKSVVGISGGLDSTLALLVSVYAHRKLGIPASDIIAITMPGFGTTDRTYDNALLMMKTTGATIREISIVPSVTQHFEDIEHDLKDHSVTYENAQARERTQILMDIANKEGGLVVGTGDLSEEALGWCTFNGDHISMYGVNAGVPKSAIKDIIRWFIDYKLKEDLDFAKDNALLAKTLEDILDTPISPELLPPDEQGNMTQKTEDKVGPYELHDFFIYNVVRYGFSPKKVLFLATIAFDGKYDEDYIKTWLKTFYKRFFAQQFKRTCSPDSPRIGTVDLSPLHWQMPSDVSADIWLEDLELF